MIETRRSTSARILKQRDVPTLATQPAVAAFDMAPAPALVSPPVPELRCAPKEVKLSSSASGTRMLDVRCSCGEWTRVELQLDTPAEAAR